MTTERRDWRAFFPTEDEIPADARLPGPIEQREWLVGGELRTWEGPLKEARSPVCVRRDGALEQALVGRFPSMDEEAALAALDAASRAFDRGRGAWPTMSVAERIGRVEEFLFRMQERRDEVVRLLSWEVGKPLADARKEFDRTAQYVRDTIDAVKELDRTSSRFVVEEGVLAQIRRSPLGVVLSMGPYNYPLNETFTTLIPALVMGNCAVVKPPRFGALLWRPLLDAFRAAFPPGVVGTIYGDGPTIVGPLMRSGGVDVLAFIGSSRVADALRRDHPRPHRLRGVLGLDAKNAAIVLPDADLDLAVRECLLGALSFNGQRCTAIKLIYVHKRVAEPFVAALAAAADGLKRGMPWEDGVAATPLPEPGKPQKLRAMCDEALAKGARIVGNGGTVVGTFFDPAVVYPVDSSMRLAREEQFGPVVPVSPFEDVADVVEAIVASEYGQQVSLFGRDPKTLGPLIDVMANQVCRVNLNSQCQRGPDTFPFNGRKDSAEGTLSVTDALRAFSIRALVAARTEEANKRLVTDIVRGRTSNFLSTDFIL